MIEGSYTWLEDTLDFKLEDLRKGLDWLSKEDCPTCKNIVEPWCEVLKCEKVIDMRSCLLCEDLPSCPRTSYQRDRYPFVLEYHQKVKKIGLKKHYEDERKKAQEGITLNDIRKW